eukprot:Gb_14487 [translate_table: standard]
MATRSPNNQEISRTEIQAALAKAVELRALHAALVQGNSPGKLKPQTCPSPSGSRHSAQDYPVFTPTYEEETVPAYQQIKSDPRRMSLNWDEGQADEVESIGTEKGSPVIAMRRRSGLFSRGPASSTMEHSLSTSSSIRNVTGLQSSLGNATPHALKPNLNSTVERKKILNGANSTVSCNRCKPAALGRENPTVVPLTESQDMIELPQKDRSGNGLFKSWLFSRAKKKTAKTQTSPNNFDPAYISQSMEEWGMALEALKQKLLEANENRDSAVTEVAELRSSMGELEKKLRQLELYCQDLKHALNQTVQDGNVAVTERSGVKNYEEAITCRYADEEHVDRVGSRNPLPVSSEAMVEGFLQIVSEARVSVKQFCRTLVTQIQELDGGAMENLNSLLQPYNVSVTSRVSRGVMYHLESLINQAIYQDFENCSFQKNGSQTILDTQESCQANFDSFASLRNLSWNEVLSKGTRFYSESFSRFCDQKMSLIVSMLNWTRAWPEPLLQAFFIAAKCVWLVHLLAFSFNPPLAIFRVEKTTNFDPVYMEDILTERHRRQVPSKVRIMVMPGFYVQDDILRCKVLCRYRNGA